MLTYPYYTNLFNSAVLGQKTEGKSSKSYGACDSHNP